MIELSSVRFTLTDLGRFLIVAIMATASFDVFLNLRLGGFSFRFCFVLIGLLFILYLYEHNHRDKLMKLRVVGLWPLLAWSVLLTLFIPNTTSLLRNIGYMAWYAFLLNFILILPYYIQTQSQLSRMLLWYKRTFCGVALFGLLQFMLGLAGVSLLTEQWWNNHLARINAFSYEPSYFATYIVIGWGMTFYQFAQNKSTGSFALLTITIILSSSRMGIGLILLVVSGYGLYSLGQLLFTNRIRRTALKIIVSFAIVVSLGTYAMVAYWETIAFLFKGVGVTGQPAHSTEARSDQFWKTLSAFEQSPLIGYSLGGIPSAIGALEKYVVASQEEAKLFEGMNVWAETLAASGIVGFAFFVWFMGKLLHRCYQAARLSKRQGNSVFSHTMWALLTGMALELIMLNFNQTLLRPYLWVHIAVLNAAYWVWADEKRREEQQDEVSGETAKLEELDEPVYV